MYPTAEEAARQYGMGPALQQSIDETVTHRPMRTPISLPQQPREETRQMPQEPSVVWDARRMLTRSWPHRQRQPGLPRPMKWVQTQQQLLHSAHSLLIISLISPTVERFKSFAGGRVRPLGGPVLRDFIRMTGAVQYCTHGRTPDGVAFKAPDGTIPPVSGAESR